jgi:hypothetical protein
MSQLLVVVMPFRCASWDLGMTRSPTGTLLVPDTVASEEFEERVSRGNAGAEAGGLVRLCHWR